MFLYDYDIDSLVFSWYSVCVGRTYLFISSGVVVFIVATAAVALFISYKNNVTNNASSLSASNTHLVSSTATQDVQTKKGQCELFSKGDFDCNGSVDLVDFDLWVHEFDGNNQKPKSDVNGDNVSSLIDYEIWREGFSKP